MIKKKTVFILGAGASVPYGFPTGDLLKERILRSIRSRSDFTRILLSSGFHEAHIEKFANDFEYSSRNSIDVFLEHNPHYHEIGKIYIAHSLAECEHQPNLLTKNRNWYNELYNRICGNNYEDILRSNISFVTFNYDRSLKQFLYNSIKYSFNKKDSEVAEVIKKIPIVQVHGHLGDLPWESLNKNYIRDYNSTPNLIDIKNTSSMIKVIHESDPTIHEFSYSKDLIQEAENIIFFGFGFHNENIKRLDLTRTTKNKRIYIDYMGPGGDFEMSIRKKMDRVMSDETLKIVQGDSLSLFHHFGGEIFN